MTKKRFFVFFLCSLSANLFAQRDTLYVDKLSGDYIIQYWGRFAFAKDSSGEHPLDYEDRLKPGQTYVEKDSFVTVVFEPATKIYPKISCTVWKEEGKLSYVYMYRIENGVDGRQWLDEFEIGFDERVTVANRTLKDGWHSDAMYELGGNGLLPKNRWMWWGDIGLEPGKELTIGGLASDGIPGIVPVSFTGRARIVSFPGSPGNEFQSRISAIHSFEGNCVKSWSLGPMPVSKPFNQLAFLDSMISSRQRCIELGWIANDSAKAEFDITLRDARRCVDNFDRVAATAKLGEFLKQLERDKVSLMTNDAYTLLKFHAEYLIDRLAEAKKN